MTGAFAIHFGSGYAGLEVMVEVGKNKLFARACLCYTHVRVLYNAQMAGRSCRKEALE